MKVILCHLCGREAIAVFAFSHGCYCDPAPVQALCLHHSIKSGPPPGGTMELVEDLTRDGSFAAFWAQQGQEGA